jgi:succinate dehydrogenase/fumarate reductase flavoprotein subunit
MQGGKTWRDPPDPVPQSEIIDSQDADIVIIGAGPAGTCAARAACEIKGNRVIVLEQQEEEKFFAWASEVGSLNARFCLDRGVPGYDPLDLMADWQRRNLNRSNPMLVKDYAFKSGETFDWFIEPLDEGFRNSINIFMHPGGKKYTGIIAGYRNFTGTCIFRGGDKNHDYTFTKAVKLNQRLARDNGALFFFSMSGEQLAKEGNRVTGIVAKDKAGKYHQFNGKKGIIIAAGDFSKNEEMCADLLGEYNMLTTTGKPMMGWTWDGKGVQMGYWAGGKLSPGPFATLGGADPVTCGPLRGTPFLRLNKYGKRFTNESIMGTWAAGIQSARQPHGVLSSVWDSAWKEHMQYFAPDHAAIDTDNPVIWNRLCTEMDAVLPGPAGGEVHDALTSMEKGQVFKVYSANSLSDLADYLGYAGEYKSNFLQSIERYSDLARLGRDEDFAMDGNIMFPIENPPFYGIVGEKTVKSCLCVMSGLFIDGEQRVLGEGFEPVPGLYATGNASGERWAVSYNTPIGGCSVGMALTLGRVLGLSLAK